MHEFQTLSPHPFPQHQVPGRGDMAPPKNKNIGLLDFLAILRFIKITKISNRFCGVNALGIYQGILRDC